MIWGRAARRGDSIRRVDFVSHRRTLIRRGEDEVNPMISVTQESVPMSQHWREGGHGAIADGP